MSSMVIHILGASGSGTTTLGKALSESYSYTHLDTDDYFWLPTMIPFTEKRDVYERQKLLEKDMLTKEKCVITGSLCGWGDLLIPYFSLVVYIFTSTELRIERLGKREFERFGERILKNGDMYVNHTEFIEWSKSYDTASVHTRSAKMHEEWLKQITCPVIRLDGSQSVQSHVNIIRNYTTIGEGEDNQ